MKRFLLIAAGTVGGLGAVLSITPPQLGAASGGLGLDMGTLPTTDAATQTPVATQSSPSAVATSTAATPTQSATTSATKSSTPTKSATPAASKSSSATPTQSSSATSTPTVATTPTQTATPTPTPTPTPTKTVTPTQTPTKTATPTPTVKSASGTFTGSVVNVNYGYVQVEITVSNGKITDARALQAPSGRNDRYTNYALPILKQQTLAAQSTNIQGATGASYTSYGWRKSLQSAMAKAGL